MASGEERARRAGRGAYGEYEGDVGAEEREDIEEVSKGEGAVRRGGVERGWRCGERPGSGRTADEKNGRRRPANRSR